MEDIRRTAIDLLGYNYNLTDLLFECGEDALKSEDIEDKDSVLSHVEFLSIKLELPPSEIGPQLVGQEINRYASLKTRREDNLMGEPFKRIKTLITSLRELERRNAFNVNYFVRKFRNMYVPLEVLWCLDDEKVLSVENYLLNNLKDPENLANLSRDLALFTLDFHGPVKKQIVQSILQKVLYTLCMTAYSPKTGSSGSKSYAKICIVIMETLQRKIFDYLKKTDKSQAIGSAICNVYGLLNRMHMPNEVMKLMASNSIKFMLSYSPNLTASDALLYQNQWSITHISIDLRAMVMELSHPLDDEEILNVLLSVLEEREVNWELVLSYVSVLIDNRNGLREILNVRLRNLVMDGLEYSNEEKLIMCFLLARQMCLASGGSSYEIWFSSSFCKTSSLSKKTFQTLIKFLIDLVQYDILSCLEVHVKCLSSVPRGCRVILSDYLALAKTRIHDLKKAGKGSVDETVIKEVEKVILQYKINQVLPGYLLEKSIFHKAYFTDSFLPALRLVSCEEENKKKLLMAFLESGRISESEFDSIMTSQNDSSKELSPVKELEELLKYFMTCEWGEMSARLLEIKLYLQKLGDPDNTALTILKVIYTTKTEDAHLVHCNLSQLITLLGDFPTVLHSVCKQLESKLLSDSTSMSLDEIKLVGLLLVTLNRRRAYTPDRPGVPFVDHLFKALPLSSPSRRDFYLQLATEFLSLVTVMGVEEGLSEIQTVPTEVLVRFQFLIHRHLVDETSGMIKENLSDARWLSSYRLVMDPVFQNMLLRNKCRLSLRSWLTMEMTTDHDELGGSPCMYQSYLMNSVVDQFWPGDRISLVEIILSTLVTVGMSHDSPRLTEVILMLNQFLSQAGKSVPSSSPSTILRVWVAMCDENSDPSLDTAFCRIVSTLVPWSLVTNQPFHSVNDSSISELGRLINSRLIHHVHSGAFLSIQVVSMVITSLLSMGEVNRLLQLLEECPCLKLSCSVHKEIVNKLLCMSNHQDTDLGLTIAVTSNMDDNIATLTDPSFSKEHQKLVVVVVLMEFCWQWLLSGVDLEIEELDKIVNCLEKDHTLFPCLNVVSLDYQKLIPMFPCSLIRVYPYVAIEIIGGCKLLLLSWSVGEQILLICTLLDNFRYVFASEELHASPYYAHCFQVVCSLVKSVSTDVLQSINQDNYKDLPSDLQFYLTSKSQK